MINRLSCPDTGAQLSLYSDNRADIDNDFLSIIDRVAVTAKKIKNLRSQGARPPLNIILQELDQIESALPPYLRWTTQPCLHDTVLWNTETPWIPRQRVYAQNCFEHIRLILAWEMVIEEATDLRNVIDGPLTIANRLLRNFHAL